ncbi:MAG: DUF1775 domain-containing protein [Sulfitobacter sp.]
MFTKSISSALLLTLFSATMATSHATLEVQSAAVGSTYKGVMRIGHGCDGQATLSVAIQIPEGMISVKPMPKPGWALDTQSGAYARSYEYYGNTLTEGVQQIIWTGSLKDTHYDEFVFRGTLSDTLTPGESLYFPTVQTCADGTSEWINIPAKGQDPHDLEDPAPGLVLSDPAHAHH